MKFADPTFNSDQSWCETNEAKCREQEDGHHGSSERMVGKHWA